MKLTLEPQAVEVPLEDPRFPLARVYKGVTEDGRRVMALIACVESRNPPEQPKLTAELAALPTEMFLNSKQTSYLFSRGTVA